MTSQMFALVVDTIQEARARKVIAALLLNGTLSIAPCFGFSDLPSLGTDLNGHLDESHGLSISERAMGSAGYFRECIADRVFGAAASLPDDNDEPGAQPARSCSQRVDRVSSAVAR